MGKRKKTLWLFVIGLHSFIASFIILLSRICFYIDTIDGSYLTEPMAYVPKEALVVCIVSIVAELFIVFIDKKQDN